jgi:hypothetical protein
MPLLGCLKFYKQALGDIQLLCGREVLPVIHAFWYIHSFYLFPHSTMIYPSQFKFPYQFTLPQHLQADMQAARVKCLALKMDHH